MQKLQERQGDKSPYSKHYITDAIREKYNSLVKKDEGSWNDMISVGQMIAYFIEGKQILDWNPYTNAYTPRKLKRTDPNKIKAVNFMQYYCTNWQAKWNSSNPDIVVSPNSNDDREISKARKANAVVDYLERNMYGEGAWYGLHEGLLAQVFGWYGNRVRPDNRKGMMVEMPVTSEREVQIGKGYGKCHDCDQWAGSEFNSIQISQTDSMPICPNCGSTAVYYEPPVTQIMPFVSGSEQIRIPDIIAEQLPFAACRWDIRFRAENSSWFLYEQDVDEGAIRRSLGNIRLPEGGTPNTLGLDVVASLAAMGSPIGGRGTTSYEKKRGTTVSELYLGPEDLWDIKVRGDEETIDGTSLPQGERLSDVFPDGACFVGINGFALLTGIHAEHHSDTITSGVYHMKALSGTGRGVGDAVEAQKRWNRQDSGNVAQLDAKSRPATLHAEGAIPPNKAHLLGQPDVNIPIAIQNFPEVRSIGDLVQNLQPLGIEPSAMQYAYNYLQNFMQMTYHVTNLGGPSPQGVQNDTATFAEIMDSNSDMIFSPVLDIKADVYLATARKAFNQWCKYNPVPRHVSFKNPTKAGTQGIAVSGQDVAGEYNWSWVPGSQIPKNKRTQQNNRVSFYGLFGGITGYLQAKAQMPQQVADVERDFDMDFATDDFDEIGELCRTRLEMAKELLAQSEMLREQAAMAYGVEVPPANPLLVLPEVKPTMLVTEDNLPEQAKWFSRLLSTPEGQRMTDSERALVSAFVQGLMMLAQGQEIAVQTGMNEVAVASNAPVQQAEMVNQAQQAELAAASQPSAETPTVDPENEAQRQHEMATKVLEVANSEEERKVKKDLAQKQAKSSK